MKQIKTKCIGCIFLQLKYTGNSFNIGLRKKNKRKMNRNAQRSVLTVKSLKSGWIN